MCCLQCSTTSDSPSIKQLFFTVWLTTSVTKAADSRSCYYFSCSCHPLRMVQQQHSLLQGPAHSTEQIYAMTQARSTRILEDGEPLPFHNPQAVRSCVENDYIKPSQSLEAIEQFPRLHHLPRDYHFYRSGDDGRLHFNAAVGMTRDRTLQWHYMLANILTEAAAVSARPSIK